MEDRYDRRKARQVAGLSSFPFKERLDSLEFKRSNEHFVETYEEQLNAEKKFPLAKLSRTCQSCRMSGRPFRKVMRKYFLTPRIVNLWKSHSPPREWRLSHGEHSKHISGY